MFDLIMEYFAQGILLLLSLFIYVLLVACLYPKLLLKPRCGIGGPKDRGIRKYRFDTGRAITYEPVLSMRDYVYSYILSVNNGEKHIKCEIDPRISLLRYDVLAYGADDRVIAIVEICDPIQNRGQTHAAQLPMGTSYVQVIVREVNGKKISREAICAHSPMKLLIFTLLTVLTTVAWAFLWRDFILTVAELLDLFTVTVGDGGTLFTWISSILLGLICAGINVLTYWPKYTKLSR